MADREVFPNAPLEFVAAEVRYPYAPRLTRRDIIDVLIDKLGDVFPIAQPEESHNLLIGPDGGQVGEAQRVHRLLAKNRRASLTVSQDRFVVETTDYGDYSDFRYMVERSAECMNSLDVVVGVDRIGLRYIDEIRVPGVSQIAEWRGYVDGALLGILDLAPEYEPQSLEGVFRLGTGPDRGVLYRYGVFHGTGVVGGGPLKRRREFSPGLFFVLDTDSYWQGDELGEFAVDSLIGELDRLHEPVGSLFHRSITDRLRNEVLRKVAASE